MHSLRILLQKKIGNKPARDPLEFAGFAEICKVWSYWRRAQITIFKQVGHKLRLPVIVRNVVHNTKTKISNLIWIPPARLRSGMPDADGLGSFFLRNAGLRTVRVVLVLVVGGPVCQSRNYLVFCCLRPQKFTWGATKLRIFFTLEFGFINLLRGLIQLVFFSFWRSCLFRRSLNK